MDITLNEDRKPIGTLTWVARFRDGTELAEFGAADAKGVLPDQVSFDRVAERDDVEEVVLLPIFAQDNQRTIHIYVQPGEHVRKKWIRTHFMVMESGGEQGEMPVIDAFVLVLDTVKPVHHFIFMTGEMLITSNPEPPL